MGIFEEKQSLYEKYSKEKADFRNTSIKPSEECNNYINSKYVSWKNVFDNDGTLVGFLLIGKESPMKHKKADYSICEAYVIPDKRGMGLMTSRLNHYIADHKGIFSILIHSDDIDAVRFFDDYFSKINAKKIALKDDPKYTKENFTTHAWKIK